MQGRHHFEVLSNAHSREHLIQHAKANGVNWDEHSHEGVNWMRASRAITRHLNDGKEFDTDPMDEQTVRQMLHHYTELREHHKKTMIPHLRSAMSKLHAQKGDPSVNYMDLLDEAHEHLKANGGHVWAEKLHTLHHLNHKIKHLTSKLTKQGTM